MSNTKQRIMLTMWQRVFGWVPPRPKSGSKNEQISPDHWLSTAWSVIFSVLAIGTLGKPLLYSEQLQNVFSNILMIKTSGKIAHIDFGDSFEAAERREHVPEKVPFRLTRMFVKVSYVTVKQKFQVL